ncbi:DUF7172 family protein [Nocardia cyriacigeorgica]|uniref:DUF7172 domain-containing protein n=1 Tax=Nocardia cyriacigeorgica TaxID=135487 RepID=A0A5R8NHK2_9NOCA|nr:hypothetical protein [Nocardia cyriacigeorgica]TLF74067.1 hypothetical protein FEK34_25445 [Nocardia cyriacigeorgica]
MAQVCVDRNLSISNGMLGIEPWSVFRLVADVTGASVGDGTLARTTRLPGKLMINLTASWISDSPLPSRMLMRITRAHRSITTSNPNAIQFRDAWETAIDATPRVPDPSRVLNSQAGTSLDMGTNNVAEPHYGREFLTLDSHSSDIWLPDPVPAGSTLTVHYRCYVWTPPPWSDNASGNQPLHEARARWTRLQLFAVPQQDEAIQ